MRDPIQEASQLRQAIEAILGDVQDRDYIEAAVAEIQRLRCSEAIKSMRLKELVQVVEDMVRNMMRTHDAEGLADAYDRAGAILLEDRTPCEFCLRGHAASVDGYYARKGCEAAHWGREIERACGRSATYGEIRELISKREAAREVGD